MKTTMKAALAAAALAWLTPLAGQAQTVDELLARNLAARGGGQAWAQVSSLQMTGRMEIGRDVMVPYVMEQKRPGKMRLEFEFDSEPVVQTYDGKAGWKLTPFLGRRDAQPMSAAELREAAGSSDPRGLLIDGAQRGNKVELIGRETVQGRDAFKLKVTLPEGAVRWVYLDAETALEVKQEMRRKLGQRERLVETYFYDWQPEQGLLIARRQETRTEGRKNTLPFLVQKVRVNVQLADERFGKPASLPPRPLARNGK